MNELSSQQLVQLTAGLCGGMYSLILFGLFWFTREKQDQKQRFLSWIFLDIACANFSEVILAVFTGKISSLGFFMTRSGKFIDLLFSTLLVVLVAKYITCILDKERDKKIQKWIRAIEATWGVFALMMLLNIFYPILYTYNAWNEYQRYTNVWVGFIMYATWGFLLLCLFWNAAKDAPRLELLVSFFILMSLIVMVILQSFVFSASVINAVLTLMMSVIYMIWRVYYDKVQFREMDAAHKKMEELQNEIEETSVRIAVSQLKPHFMYNTLISIRYLIEENPAKAIEIMDDFMAWSRSLVTTLDRTGLIPLEQEMEYTTHYMKIQQFRFDNRIQYAVSIEDGSIKIPPLSIMTIVENSISHGIRKTKDGRGKIEIDSRRFGDTVLIRVADDGVGFDPHKAGEISGTHTGLRNVKKRLELLAGGSLNIDSEPGHGTVATIMLPLERKKNENITG